MFRNREDAARQLAARLTDEKLHEPLVLAIPRGGVVTGAVLAHALGAELDVVLSRKLRAPGQPELAIGAVGEGGEVYLNRHTEAFIDILQDYLIEEGKHESDEIIRRQRLFRAGRLPVRIAGRSVIVADDGLATGATMIAALQTVKTHNPRELIVAVPVAPPDRLEGVRRWCDRVVCLLSPEDFGAVSQYYEDFAQVSDREVARMLRRRPNSHRPKEPAQADVDRAPRKAERGRPGWTSRA